MRRVIINNLSSPQVNPVIAQYCDTFLCKLVGMTFRRSLLLDEGLLLVGGRDSRLDSAIHMLGVWIDLSVVWINSEERVVDVRLARRWRLAYFPMHPARFVLEMAAARLVDFRLGDRVQFEEL